MSHEGEICQDCGLPVALAMGSFWHAPDDLWREVMGGLWGVLCPRCFFVRCDKLGVAIHWHAIRGLDADGAVLVAGREAAT